MDFQPAGLRFEAPAPEIHVEFNLAQGKAELTNEWGLPPTTLSYEALTQRAFETLESLPDGITPEDLEPVFTDLLCAVYQDRGRFEAFYGLGYACVVAELYAKSLKYLEAAYQLSSDPGIGELMRQVRAEMHA